MSRSTPMRRATRNLLALLATAAFSAGCGSGGGGSPTLASIAIGPAPVTVARGATLQLVATGTFSDGSTSDLTSGCTWASGTATVASVSSTGALTGQAIGTASVTATASGVTGTATATVTAPAISAVAVTPAAITLAPGGAQQLTATATYGDGSTADVTSQATWTSSAEAVVAVSAAGLATASPAAVAGATGSVTAALGGKQNTSAFTIATGTLVGVAVTPRTGDVVAGQALQLTATATWSDGTTGDVTSRATWTSATPAAVTVSATGRAAADASARIGVLVPVSAAFGNLTGSASLRVVRGAPIGPTRTSDPLAGQEWFLVNIGQTAFADVGGEPGADLRLQGAYDLGLSGAGVKVGIMDTGLEVAHEDLAARMVDGSWNFRTGIANPTNTWATDGDHGTCVAGIAAMTYDNQVGGMGVAPRVTLNGYAWIDSTQTLEMTQKSLGQSPANPRSDDVWVFNQSWGSSVVSQEDVDPKVDETYAFGVAQLRSRKGAVYVKSAGNNFGDYTVGRPPRAVDCAEAVRLGVTCQNVSADPINTLPYNLVIGALNASGVKASYSSAGSAIWVAAPGGEYGENERLDPRKPAYWYQPAMVTADQSDCTKGYARTGVTTSAFDAAGPENRSCNYTNGMNGTSSAAPSTTGAIALLLDARPDLGWRDVKHILARTATKVDPSRAPVTVALTGGDYVAELPWITNAAGYDFHDWYGFGAVNVDAAIELARTWTVGTLGTLVVRDWVSSGTIAVPIPDFGVAGATSTITVPAGQGLVVEAVQIRWSATHNEIKDLGVQLTSPQGTTSMLFNVRSAFETGNPVDMVLLSNAFYGERSAGTWTVKVVDARNNGVSGTLTNWQIRVFGH